MNQVLGNILIAIVLLFILYMVFARAHVLARKKFKCLRCGHCCRLRVKLSKQEIEEIKKKGHVNFMSRLGYIKRKNGYCQFLEFKDGKTECSLEDIKPKVCKKFPSRKGLIGEKIDTRCKTCHGKFW